MPMMPGRIAPWWHLSLLLAAAVPVHAQMAAIAPGDTVRVSNGTLISESLRIPRADLEGVLVEADAQGLLVAADGTTQTVVLGSRSRVEVRRGDRAWGPVKGALLGLGVALVAGLAWEGSDSLERRGCEIVDYSIGGNPLYRCERDARNMDETWFAAGGLAGLVMGSVVRVPRWEAVSTPALRLDASLAPSASGLALRLRLRGAG